MSFVQAAVLVTAGFIVGLGIGVLGVLIVLRRKMKEALPNIADVLNMAAQSDVTDDFDEPPDDLKCTGLPFHNLKDLEPETKCAWCDKTVSEIMGGPEMANAVNRKVRQTYSHLISDREMDGSD